MFHYLFTATADPLLSNMQWNTSIVGFFSKNMSITGNYNWQAAYIIFRVRENRIFWLIDSLILNQFLSETCISN